MVHMAIFQLLHFVTLTIAIVLCTLAVGIWILLKCTARVSKWIEENLHKCVRCIFPWLEEGCENTYTLFGYTVPKFFIEQLLIYFIVTLTLSTQVFISSYLFIKSYGCSMEPYIHCYEAKVHFLIIGAEELDCKDPLAIQNITSIICYDLAFDLTHAIDDAAATIAGAAVYFVLITWILLKLSEMQEICANHKCTCICKLCIVTVQGSIMLFVLAIVMLQIVALILDKDTVYEDIVHIAIRVYMVIIGGIIPWWKFTKLNDQSNGRQRDNNDSNAPADDSTPVADDSTPVADEANDQTKLLHVQGASCTYGTLKL